MPLLELWRLRQVRNPPEQPERGSALAADDRVFPQFPISEVARLSLISSGEHLRLVIDGLERENLYSTAQHTALRGALVGAAQAVWILHPDDPTERRERGLRVVAYGYDELRKYHQKTLQIQDLLGLDDLERAQVDDQIAWIRGRESSVSNARNNCTTRLNLTEVIKESSSIAFANQKDQAALQLWWSALSSDAHVLVWGLATRATFDPATTNRLTGLSIGVAGTDADQLRAPFELILRLLKHGWSLFDRGCEGP